MTSTPPIESVARVATTPEQAKVFVAMLQGEGIPARIEGDSLTDEFAASRRLMNLLGTRVMVPTSSLARAQEILRPAAIDPAELEREALAAPVEIAVAARVTSPAEDGAARGSAFTGPLLVVAVGAAALCAWQWHSAREDALRLAAQVPPPSAQFEYRPDGDTWRDVRRKDGRTVRVLHDAGRDGNYERVDTLDATGRVLTSADDFVDGFYGRVVETRANDFQATWLDVDHDGLFDRCSVTDASGKVVQTLEWQAGRGFVIKTP